MLSVPTLDGEDISLKRIQIKDYFLTVFDRYERLFGLLHTDEGYYQRPEILRHPLIFYFGHTATFFVNKLKLAQIITQRINPRLESIFAVGVDEMSWDDLNDAHYEWPSVTETKIYRDKVRDLVVELIETLPMTLPITQSSPWWIILMGIEHENIHLETSSVLLRQLDINSISPKDEWKICDKAGSSPPNELLFVEGGEVKLGKLQTSPLYGWDNEYGHHTNTLKGFEASKYLVSHGEFLEFVQEGGYENESYWSSEGVAWRQFRGATHPTFWVKTPHGYDYRTLHTIIPLPLDWPAEVNYLEAEAFCRWLSQKIGKIVTLPSEDETIHLLNLAMKSGEVEGNLRLKYFASSVPINTFKHGDFYDVVGNVWQWSRTPIYPFEGFAVHPIYDDFTVPTFDNKHNLIKGGSWASCGNLADHQSRYAFRRHFFQHAGFRYVVSPNHEVLPNSPYEEDTQIALKCHDGWGEGYFGCDNFYRSTVQKVIEIIGEKPKKRVLDLGCGAGRSSFELAKVFESVTGVDFTARIIQNAQMMKTMGEIRYAIPTQGEMKRYCKVDIKSFGLENTRHKVEFWQGDGCNLKPILSGYDTIIAHDILDRLYDPVKFLESMGERVVEGGLFILTSGYDWNPTKTPQSKWVGGVRKDGENFTTLEAMGEILSQYFTLLATDEVERVRYQSERKFTHSLLEMSVWQRR